VRFSEEKIHQGAQLANKLWNASRFVLLRVEDGVEPAPRPKTIEDRWILSRLQRAKANMRRSIEGFEFHHAALGLYDFVFGELCDRYIELVKPRLDDRDVQATLLHVLGATLALAHPVIPFVTEEIWSYLPAADGLLGGASWPAQNDGLTDAEAEAAVERQFAAVQEVRRWRDKVNVPPGPRLPARLEAPGYEALADGIALLARLEWSSNGEEPVASVAIPGGAVAVLASDHVDLEADRRHREEVRATLEAEIRRAEGKLGNEGFVSKAPPQVVQAERDKLEQLRRELEELDES
jgi:valyl-tRNA synthetase